MNWIETAHDAQLEPREDWTTWLFLGGRGAGKTRAGAESLMARALSGWRLALVGPTFHDVREVMIDGPSGLRTIAPEGFRPRWEASRRRLVWPNDATAYAFSAEDPESLRGPQFHFAWADEFCAWARPTETLAMLRFGMRLGPDPRLVVTTTPKPGQALRDLMKEAGTRKTHAPSADNAANLAPTFLSGLQALYGGTRLAAQEMDGLVVEAAEGALWRAEDLIACRGPAPERLDRIVVAVDPPATSTGDACGIVAAGRVGDRAYVLADRTLGRATPARWAARVVETALEFSADVIVAEANQGGEMVGQVLAQHNPPCPVRLVRARFGKRLRAEPVAALYEQGRVTHCGSFRALEEELMAFGSGDLGHSPDRADALVWALGDLLLARRGDPSLRRL